jgi:hypothetical protein
MISVDRRGVGRVSLSDTELSVLESEVGDTLAALGYDRPTRPVPLDGLA